MTDDKTEKTQEEQAQGSAENLLNELDEAKKQYLYLRADFDNYRKQVIKERAELVKFGAEPTLREFLNILDNLERAAHTPVSADTLEAYKNGIELIITQFKKSLERFGVQEVPCFGEPFDPNVHEALSSISDPNIANNTVAEVFKKAYKLHGKVIRPAQVVVNTVKEN
ncbi:MAG: nucleotide exchange factor GrpE [Oligoflexia bacterium]|nr:nucleotide exchange factor GrpE [Oligoflexia bacterium]